MMYDPGRLARDLETLVKELSDWSYAIKETRAIAAFEQRQTEEIVVQAEQQAKIAANQLAHDQELIHKMGEALTTAQDVYREACNIARQTLARAEDAHTQAISTLKHWQEELQIALAWLARARTRLEKAIRDLHSALAELSSARVALSNAQSALRSCTSDSKRNCSGEYAAVQRADDRVSRAQAAVARAEKEKRDAELEVAQAQARVTACTRAVEFARQAVALAQETAQTARQGLNFAERSLEHLEAAYKGLQDAIKALQWEEDEVSAMLVAVRAATVSLDEARQHQRTAEYHEQAAQNASYRARYDIQDRVQRLYDLNRTDLYTLGNAAARRIVPFLGAVAAATSIAAQGAIIYNHIHVKPTTTIQQQVMSEAQIQASKNANEEQKQRDEQLMHIAETATDTADAARDWYEKMEKNE